MHVQIGIVPRRVIAVASATALAVIPLLTTNPTGVSASAWGPRVTALTATTYDVAPNGTDSNPCTTSAPCATLLHATSLAQPGDTVLVEAGTYGPQTITANGAPGARITIAAHGSVTLTRPLPLTNNMQSTYLLRLNGSSYVTVTGLTIIGAKEQPGYNATLQPYGGELEVENHDPADPGDGIVLRDNTVLHANNTCIKLEDHQPNAIIEDNTVSDCGSAATINGTYEGHLDHGIYTSGPNTLIANNIVSGSTGYGIQAWPTGGGDVGGSVISGNTVHDSAEFGVVAGGSPVTVANNVIYNNGHGGVQIEDYSHVPTTALPDVVASNVMANNGSGDPSTADVSLGNHNSAGAVIENNTIYNGARYTVSSLHGLGSIFDEPFLFENNIVYGNPTMYGSPNTSMFNDPIPASSVVDHNLYFNVKPVPNSGNPSYDGGHSLVQVDPMFVNTAASPLPDLHLSSGSPAVGAATPLHLPDGTTAHDLGALCATCGGSGATPTPPVPPTVGSTRVPTATPTRVPATPTRSVPTPTATTVRQASATPTRVKPTATATMRPSATPRPTEPSATNTPVPVRSTATPTRVPATATPTERPTVRPPTPTTRPTRVPPVPTATRKPTVTPTPSSSLVEITRINVSPRIIGTGHTVDLSALLRSRVTLKDVHIDYEVYAFSGKYPRVLQAVQNGVTLQANVYHGAHYLWTVPSSLPTGKYIFKIGVFDARWTHVYGWYNAGAIFQVIHPT